MTERFYFHFWVSIQSSILFFFHFWVSMQKNRKQGLEQTFAHTCSQKHHPQQAEGGGNPNVH